MAKTIQDIEAKRENTAVILKKINTLNHKLNENVYKTRKLELKIRDHNRLRKNQDLLRK